MRSASACPAPCSHTIKCSATPVTSARTLPSSARTHPAQPRPFPRPVSLSSSSSTNRHICCHHSHADYLRIYIRSIHDRSLDHRDDRHRRLVLICVCHTCPLTDLEPGLQRQYTDQRIPRTRGFPPSVRCDDRRCVSARALIVKA